MDRRERLRELIAEYDAALATYRKAAEDAKQQREQLLSGLDPLLQQLKLDRAAQDTALDTMIRINCAVLDLFSPTQDGPIV
jgi:outer membrane protein TolC